MPNLIKLTDTAAEAIRSANHATLYPGTVTVPDTDAAVAKVAVLADCLDQLLRQLAANVESRHGRGGLTLDGFHGANAGGDPTAQVGQALTELALAGHDCVRLAGGLHEVHNILAHIRDDGGRRR